MLFIADDLFVNFDDERAATGLIVLTELAASTQVLVFTHHAHLRSTGQAVGGLRSLEL
ncbi:Chromosome partition protein smc [Azospirillum doebereinerae]